MATITTIKHLYEHVGEEVILRGWVYNKRGSGKILFLLVRDGSGICQTVFSKNSVSEEVFELVKNKLTQESSIIVKGICRKEERAPGGYELDGISVEPVQIAVNYPIQPKEHGVDFLLEKRHLWLRSRKQHAIFSVRNELVMAIRQFFYDREFFLMDAPIFTPNACEGTTTLFETDYFDEGKAYLTQSGQLYNEAAAMAFGKVYCFGPTFRAEKSKTRRHLTEFWMVEPEIAWATLDDIMDLAEEFVEYIVGRVLEKCRKNLEILERDIKPLEKIKRPFKRITYDEALALINSSGESLPWGEDFGAPHETIIGNSSETPVLVHRYPVRCKAFYMKADPARPEVALCVDMIAPEGFGEIIGGGQRADDYDYLVAQIEKHNLPREAFEWYLDLRKYGTVPHGGFGLGIERTIAWICGLPHVRETIPFPRLMERIYP